MGKIRPLQHAESRGGRSSGAGDLRTERLGAFPGLADQGGRGREGAGGKRLGKLGVQAAVDPSLGRASSIRRAKAGPLPLTAVTVSRSASRTTTAVPTEEKNRFAVSLSSIVAEAWGATAVLPLRRRTAVLGLERMTRALPPAARKRSSECIPATTETRSLPESPDPSPETTPSAWAGLTQRKTTEASRTASALEAAARTPRVAAAAEEDSGVREETVIRSPVVMPEASMPRTKAPPILPPPRIAMFIPLP